MTATTKGWVVVQYDENACECGGGDARVLFVIGPLTEADAKEYAASPFRYACEAQKLVPVPVVGQ